MDVRAVHRQAIYWSGVVFLAIVLLACSSSATPTVPPASPKSEAQMSFSYTHQQPDGNRLVAGRGSVPNVSPIDIPLAFIPKWVVAAPMAEGSLWVVVLIDGRVQSFHLNGDSVEQIPITPEQLPVGMPPLLRLKDGEGTLVTPPPASGASEATHPVILSTGEMAFVGSNGDLVLWDVDEVARLPLNALPDARLLVDQKDRILLLTDQTTRYAHGVLGDQIEAGSITLVETSPPPHVALTIPIPEPSVIEGIAPIWADLTGDGIREIIVTVSNEQVGAKVVVFDEKGQQIATGPAIGRAYRWRHKLVVGPFGPTGEPELTEAITPHLSSKAQFFALHGDTLEIKGAVSGYTSHLIGSANLDMAIAGDFNGDGQVELVLPVLRTRAELGGLQRTEDGAEVIWTLPVGGRVITNLAAMTLADGTLILGVGHDGQTLRIWQ